MQQNQHRAARSHFSIAIIFDLKPMAIETPEKEVQDFLFSYFPIIQTKMQHITKCLRDHAKRFTSPLSFIMNQFSLHSNRDPDSLFTNAFKIKFFLPNFFRIPRLKVSPFSLSFPFCFVLSINLLIVCRLQHVVKSPVFG